MSHVTEEHREAVAEGKRVEIGGYTAVSNADLDRIETKLGKPKGGGKGRQAQTSRAEDDGLGKMGDDELRKIVAEEKVEVAADATSAAMVTAIRKKRKDAEGS